VLELALRKDLESMRSQIFEHPPASMEALKERQGRYAATQEIHQKITHILSGEES
jgi:hypothetical protein